MELLLNAPEIRSRFLMLERAEHRPYTVRWVALVADAASAFERRKKRAIPRAAS